jgi:hypothetical protein
VSGYTIVIDYGDSEETWTVDGPIPLVGALIRLATHDGPKLRELVVESVRYDVMPYINGWRGMAPYVYCDLIKPPKVSG